ncbi:cupin domain-containing protein [Streptomyces phyllanthi]|uniref:Cupin domain-containing protein n=1 Tax=Streptomyces phyllanthi TaxID=1803180 RepID=A0A5N8W7K7_9ACTN|nr:cupin domain-containing protein [Streptomyces phyllanthi]MPY43092.1 cupin domain-containing protein [Streptomyces phyllanthi]
MKVRRVLVARSEGTSRVIEDGEPPRATVAVETPGFEQTLVWCTPPVPASAYPGTDPTVVTRTLLPEPGGTSFIILTFPPDAVYAAPDFDPAAAAAEAARNSPGIAELFEPDDPGMHTTPTVDYDVVLDGELWLALDDGEVRLSAGDVVVQHGTRHAWRNKSDKPATLMAVLIGAREEAGAAERGE